VNTEPLQARADHAHVATHQVASLRVIASPKPVPPKRCAVEASAWVDSANSLACRSGVTPIPVSDRFWFLLGGLLPF
jgi:hypothetical protein